MKANADRTIFVLENTTVMAAREIVHGVMRYANTQSGWKLEVFTGHPLDAEESLRITKPDGIIAGYADWPGNPIPVSIRRTTPAVFTCSHAFSNMKAPHAIITADNKSIAEAAAKILLKKHAKCFAFLGQRHVLSWERERIKHFSTAIKSAGHTVSVFKHDASATTDIKVERKKIINWLSSLEKPCGIFAVNDRIAKSLLEICNGEGFRVPEQIKVIGVDNDEIACECSSPTLTSIMPDFRLAGFEAARILDCLMRGVRTTRQMKIGVLKVIERMSTSDHQGSGNRISLAREFMRTHIFNGGMTVESLSHAVGCSTRLLEKDFKSVLGRSIIDEVNRIRLTKVLDLLSSSNVDEVSIAQSAGFRSTDYLRNLFRKRYGSTMRKWRLENMTTPLGSAPDKPPYPRS